MAEMSIVLLEVFASPCRGAAAEVQRAPRHLEDLEVDDKLWAAGKAITVLLEVFGSSCCAVAAKVQRQPRDFDAQEVDDTLGATAKTST